MDPGPIVESLRTGDFATLERLLASGVDQAVTPDGQTALHLAARFGADAALTWLLDRDAPMNAKTRGQMTPLMFAAGGGHHSTVVALLAAGADASAVNAHGFDAERIARENGRTEVAQRLASHPRG